MSVAASSEVQRSLRAACNQIEWDTRLILMDSGCGSIVCEYPAPDAIAQKESAEREFRHDLLNDLYAFKSYCKGTECKTVTAFTLQRATRTTTMYALSGKHVLACVSRVPVDAFDRYMAKCLDEVVTKFACDVVLM